MNQMYKSAYILKTVLLGDAGVGKTSLVQRFVHDRFEKQYLLTVGLDVSTKVVTVNSKRVTLSLHDIGGQKRFQDIRSTFFRGAQLALLVYDLTRPKTLENIQSVWYPQLKKYAVTARGEPINTVSILVGNKADLIDYIAVSPAEAKEVAENIGVIDHIITSAKTNKNVDEAFTRLATAYLEQYFSKINK